MDRAELLCLECMGVCRRLFEKKLYVRERRAIEAALMRDFTFPEGPGALEAILGAGHFGFLVVEVDDLSAA